MSVPMRKDEPEFEEDLTTADLAQGKRPMSEDRLSSHGRSTQTSAHRSIFRPKLRNRTRPPFPATFAAQTFAYRCS